MSDTTPAAARRIADTTEERLDRGKIDRDDVGGDFAMGLAVHVRGGGRIGRFHQAKAGATRLVVPIGHVFDPILVLNFQIPAMRFGDVLSRSAAHVVAVHEDRHDEPPLFSAIYGAAGIEMTRRVAAFFASCERRYSGSAMPDPPISAGKSLSLGSPSFMGSTVSA